MKKQGSQKSKLLIRRKETSSRGLTREVVAWRVHRSEHFPDGIKYRFALVDPKQKLVLLLYDNHWPKGHHIHRGIKETSFNFKSLDLLIVQFDEESDEIDRRYHEGKKD